MVETQKIEFKREIPKKSYKIHNELVGLSNSGGGKLYIGRNDDGTIYKKSKKLREIDIWKMLNSFCDTKMSSLIAKYWSISDDEGNGKIIKCLPAPVPLYTVLLGKKNYFLRLQTECKSISEIEIKTLFDEVNPTLIKYEPSNFTNLMSLDGKLAEKKVLEAYGIVVSNFVTLLGTYLQNDSKLKLTLGMQEFNFWSIDNLITAINNEYSSDINIGLVRTNLISIYGKKLNEIVRELLSNAITHSLIGSEINVNLDSYSITISNNVLDQSLIEMVSRGNIKHITKNINRQRLLEFIKMMEGHSNGFNNVIKKHSIDKDIITLFRVYGRKLEIKTIFAKSFTTVEMEEMSELIKRKSLVNISKNVESSIKDWIERTPKIKIKEEVKIW